MARGTKSFAWSILSRYSRARAMPGPYHFALAKPSMKWMRGGHQEHEVVVALSENWQDEEEQPLCRFFAVTGGAYEY